MLTDKLQVTLVPEIKPDDIWNVFCTWRLNSKYTPAEQRKWCENHKDSFKNYDIQFMCPRGKYKKIKTIHNESEKILGIQLYEYEGFATFISTIITDFSEENPKLVFTVEKMSNEDDTDKKSKYKRPLFYKYIEFFIKEDKTFEKEFVNERLTWNYLENHKPGFLQIVKEKLFETKK